MKEYGIIILKSLFCYVYLVILIRYLGKKEFSQLNIFDFVVFLIVSESMMLSLEGRGFNLIYGMIATFTIVFIDRLFSTLSSKNKRIQDFLEGTPVYLIQNGQLDYVKMKKLRFTIDDLSQALRSNNISSISEVEFAIVERNGNVSIIKKDESTTNYPDAVIKDGAIDYYVLQQLSLSEKDLLDTLHQRGIYRIEEVFYCIVEKDDLFIILK